MRTANSRSVVFAIAVLLAMVLFLMPSSAQIQNPIKAARDAYNKARQEQQQKQQQQKEQQQKQQEPAASGTAQQKAPESSSPPVTLADLAKPEGPVKLGEPKDMPDIVGIRLHMTLQEADAALRAAYPKGTFQAWPVNIPGIAKPVTNGVSVNFNSAPDAAAFDVTWLPDKQIVWRVSRTAPQQRVNRGTLLAALRQKYGKETYAGGHNPEDRASRDIDITTMYWLLDEAGGRVPMPSSGYRSLMTCTTGGYPGKPTPGSFLRWELERLAPPVTGWASSCVAVIADLRAVDDPEIIGSLVVTSVNIPLAMRNAKTTTVWYRETVEKMRLEEIERTKRVQPKL